MARSRIAEAYLQIVPVMGDVGQQIAQQVTAGVQQATPAATQAGTQLGNNAGQAAGDAASSAMGGMILSGIAALGLASVLQDAFTGAMEQIDVKNTTIAALALNEEDAAKVTEAATNVYKQGFGESYEAVNDAMKGIINSIKDGRNLTADELEAMSIDVLNLSTVFGVESNEISKSINSLMGSGFVGSWEEATSLIAAGFQTLGDAGDDWGDTLAEYSGDFAALGLTGEQSLNLISEALEAGMMNTDFMADALRELGIKLRSGEAFETLDILGLDPEKIKADVEAGGDAAVGAIMEVFQRLQAADDSQLFAGVIGTQAEDFNNAFKNMDFSIANVNKSLGEGVGNMELLGETINSGPSSSLETFKRVSEQAFMEVLIPAIEAITPLLQEMATFLSENEGAATALAVGAGVLLVGGLVALTAALWGMAAAGFAAMAPMLPMIGIVLAVGAAIALLSLGVVAVYENWAGITEWFTGVFEGFLTWIPQAGQAIGDFFTGMGKSVVNFFISALNGLIMLINRAVDAMNAANPGNWLTGGAFNIPDIPQIPRYANGGLVQARPGGQLLVAGEAGENEVIVNEGLYNKLITGILSGSIGGNQQPAIHNNTLNVYQQPGESSSELVERINDYGIFNTLKPSGGVY